MALNLYRRHQRDCEAGHPEDSRSGEFEERKKGWKRCACPIFASGTLSQTFKRKSTERSEWNDARTIAAAWDDAGNWNGRAEPPVHAVPSAQSEVRISIARAIRSFLAEFDQNAARNTRKKYRLLMDKLKAFADSRGYVMVDQFTPIDIREMRISWKVSPQTAAKNMSSVKAFFEFCMANEWIDRNPGRLVKNPRGREAADKRSEQKLPFSDDDLKRMYDACETLYGKQEIAWSRTSHGNRAKAELARYRRKWTGKDLADFISLSVYTGLRISDVSTFHIDRLQETGEILLRTTKAGTHVYTWVPEWLQSRIRQRATEIGPLIFGAHTTSDLNVITDVWRRKLKNLGELCGPWKEKPSPHRFRHTFARILLQRPGVTVRDVAELLGNSEQMVRKHYSAWIPERQARLTKILKEAFDDNAAFRPRAS